jgi:hypothetical protein
MRPRKVEPVLTRIPRRQHGVQWEGLSLTGGDMSGVDDVAVAALLSPFGVELAVSMFFSPLTSAHRRAGEDR